MKRLIKIVFMLCVIVVCTNSKVSLSNAATEDALEGYGVPVKIVDDIDNYPYPVSTPIENKYSKVILSSFTLDSPGQIKAVFNCQTSSRITGSTWISSDIDGKDIIGDVFNFSNNNRETSWFLGKGTYYLINSWTTFTGGEVNIALLYEAAMKDNSIGGNSFAKSHKVGLKNTFRGFLTNTTPNEYYTFEVPERTAITLKYSFDTTANTKDNMGYCTLFDSNELFLKEGTYTRSDTGERSFTYTVEKGTYYVRLSGILGNTTLSLSPMYYDIKLTPVSDGSWTDDPINVKIKTDINFSKIIVLSKDISTSLLDNDVVWAEGGANYVTCDGVSFKAVKSGTYSVRITDIYGNNTMKKIKIANIDVKKPTVKGVTNGKAYKKPVTITWSDTQSGIDKNKTKLNGKQVSSNITITKEGKYTLYVYDVMGNYVKKVFYIDKTAPALNVTNGKTYTDTVILKVKDSVSGVKKITIDDVDQPLGASLYLYQDGEYTIKLWDNAGNYKKVSFHINKKY